jgi:hypothetical protein
MAYSQTQQRALAAIYRGDDDSVAWLQAYGATAVVVSSPASKVYWKPYAHPEIFEGVLPVLWSEEGVTVYRVPRGSRLPETVLSWRSRNRFQVSAASAPGEAISIPVSYHPGWHAEIDGRAAAVDRDPLGMIRVRPPHAGIVTVEMHYDGGWVLRLCGWVSLGALLFAAIVVVRR